MKMWSCLVKQHGHQSKIWFMELQKAWKMKLQCPIEGKIRLHTGPCCRFMRHHFKTFHFMLSLMTSMKSYNWTLAPSFIRQSTLSWLYFEENWQISVFSITVWFISFATFHEEVTKKIVKIIQCLALPYE